MKIKLLKDFRQDNFIADIFLPAGTEFKIPASTMDENDSTDFEIEYKDTVLKIDPAIISIESLDSVDDLSYLVEFASEISKSKGVLIVESPKEEVSGIFIFYEDLINEVDPNNNRKNRILMSKFVEDIAIEENVPVYVVIIADFKKNLLFKHTKGKDPELIFSCEMCDDAVNMIIHKFIDDIEGQEA